MMVCASGTRSWWVNTLWVASLTTIIFRVAVLWIVILCLSQGNINDGCDYTRVGGGGVRQNKWLCKTALKCLWTTKVHLQSMFFKFCEDHLILCLAAPPLVLLYEPFLFWERLYLAFCFQQHLPPYPYNADKRPDV